jgi:gliding motility-associated-like protein
MNYKHKNYFLPIFVFINLIVSELHSAQTLYLCREDGIRYTSISRSGTPVSWNWRFQGGDIPSSVLQNPPVVTYNSAGTFNTFVTTVFDNGQTFEDTFIVVVKDWPLNAFSLPNDTGFCAGTPFSLNLQTLSNPDATFEWSNGSKNSNITVNSFGTFWVKAFIKSGNRVCDSVYKEITIEEYPLPSVNLGQDRVMCQNQSITINATPGPNYRYQWFPNNQTTQSITTTIPGVYRVVVSTVNNCTAQDEIELIDSCPHYIFIPNVFSPNTDGLNDAFNKVWNFTPLEYTIRIYSRWGQLLYESNDLVKGWDGVYNEKPAQQDIYIYDIKYFDTDKKWYYYRGTFYLAR